MEEFNSHTKITKLISFFLCLQGILGLGLIAFSISEQIDTMNLLAGGVLLVFSLLGLISGIFLIRKKVFAFNIAMLFYLISLFSISSEYASWSFSIGIEFIISTELGNSEFGVDIFSAVMLALLVLAKKKIRNNSQDKLKESANLV